MGDYEEEKREGGGERGGREILKGKISFLGGEGGVDRWWLGR